MTTVIEKIVSDALDLPEEARAYLAEKLIESLEESNPEDFSEEWRAEIDRRCAEIDQGRVELLNADEVFAKIESSFK